MSDDTIVAYQTETGVVCARCAPEDARELPLAAVDLVAPSKLGPVACVTCGERWVERGWLVPGRYRNVLGNVTPARDVSSVVGVRSADRHLPVMKARVAATDESGGIPVPDDVVDQLVEIKIDVDRRRDQRRLRQMHFIPECLADLGSGRFEVIERPIPKDAKVVGAGYDAMSNTVFITLRSAEFSPVPDGECVPRLEPHIIRRLDEPEGDRTERFRRAFGGYLRTGKVGPTLRTADPDDPRRIVAYLVAEDGVPERVVCANCSIALALHVEFEKGAPDVSAITLGEARSLTARVTCSLCGTSGNGEVVIEGRTGTPNP